MNTTINEYGLHNNQSGNNNIPVAMVLMTEKERVNANMWIIDLGYRLCPTNTTQFIAYKGVNYSLAEIAAMKEWVKDCTWGEDYDDTEIDNMPALTVLRGIDRNFCGGLTEFILCNTEIFNFEII